jgi:hypothetical protein
MKKFLFALILLPLIITVQAQSDRADLLQNLEQKKLTDQNAITTATLRSSSRLFRTKEDLSSVILVIPSGSSVTVLGSDSTYLHVTYEENEGYIYKRQAVIDKSPVVSTEVTKAQPLVPETQPAQAEQNSRYSYLENKYGSAMAARLYAGKIWKGMNSEMVNDSWGSAEKINRITSENIIKEEWTYRNTWLYFENNTLVEWGPVRK